MARLQVRPLALTVGVQKGETHVGPTQRPSGSGIGTADCRPNVRLLSVFLPHRTCSVQVSTTSHALGEVNPGSHWDYDESEPGIVIPFPIIGLGRVM